MLRKNILTRIEIYLLYPFLCVYVHLLPPINFLLLFYHASIISSSLYIL